MLEEQSLQARLRVMSLLQIGQCQVQLAPALNKKERCQVTKEQSLQARLLVTSL